MGASPLLKNTIKVQRAVKDWTQEELARRIGVTRKTINTIENGVYVPSTVLALRMARVFGVAVEAIFQLTEPFQLESSSSSKEIT